MAEETMQIPARGMTCEHCVRAVTAALQKVPGVSQVSVSLQEQQATVTYNPDIATPADLKDAIEDEGYSTEG